jgi:hypothetical protein
VAYVTDEELRAYCRSEIDADLPYFAVRAESASRAVAIHCGRGFTVPAVDAPSVTYRYVRSADDEQVVVTHDLSDTTGVVVSEAGVVVSPTVLQWEPVNGVTFTGQTVPVMQVRRLDRPWIMRGREAVVSVSSTRWGWPSVPAEVVEATLVLGLDLARMRDTRFGVAGLDADLGVIRIRSNPYVAKLLVDLRRPETAGVGSWVLS